MNKVLENVQKEIKQIGEQGINSNNIDVLFKLVDIEKDIYEIKEKKEESGSMRGRYMDWDGYGARGRNGRYMGDYRGDYGRSGNNSGNGGNYGHDDRMYEHLDRIMECVDDYQYGRDRYRDGGTEQRLEEGLEKLMYAVCVFVESMSDFAETPGEKDIIRRHIQKMKNI